MQTYADYDLLKAVLSSAAGTGVTLGHGADGAQLLAYLSGDCAKDAATGVTMHRPGDLNNATPTTDPPTAGGHLRLHDTKSAGAFLELSPRTLEAYRLRGGGPPYFKAGRIRYAEADLLAWLESCRRTSTSDPGPVKP